MLAGLHQLGKRIGSFLRGQNIGYPIVDIRVIHINVISRKTEAERHFRQLPIFSRLGQRYSVGSKARGLVMLRCQFRV